MEDIGHAGEADIAQQTAADGGEKAHHDAGDGGIAVEHRLICAHDGEQTDGEDVEYRHEAVGFFDHNGEREHRRGRCDGDGQGERLAEDVDVALLQDHVTDETAAERDEHRQADGADEVELVLASRERARRRVMQRHEGAEVDSEQLEREWNRDAFGCNDGSRDGALRDCEYGRKHGASLGK